MNDQQKIDTLIEAHKLIIKAAALIESVSRKDGLDIIHALHDIRDGELRDWITYLSNPSEFGDDVPATCICGATLDADGECPAAQELDASLATEGLLCDQPQLPEFNIGDKVHIRPHIVDRRNTRIQEGDSDLSPVDATVTYTVSAVHGWGIYLAHQNSGVGYFSRRDLLGAQS